MKNKSAPKILVFDIETSPLLSYTWGTWDQTIALNQIKEEWQVLSYAAKWLNDPAKSIKYQDQRNDKDDKKVLEGIWKLLDEADIVITQNGVKFDSKKLNARFILHNMKPPSSYKHIDTLKIAKKYFAFTSNKLEYMAGKLNVKYKKQSHKKFPGFSLWTECLNGNKEAWNEMEKYNKYDVLALEELYHKLAVWEPAINFDVYHSVDEHVCSCGHKEFENKGYAYTASGKFRRYKCKSCGKESRGKQNLLTLEKRKSIHR